MAGKQGLNSFQEGMKQDIDILLSNNKAYRYSIGGRLMYNKNGTYSWEVEGGNKLSFSILPNFGADTDKYVPIGHAGNSSIRIIFSVAPGSGYSEIGIFSIDNDGQGTYKTLFNDQGDPNMDTLNFNPENQIEARFVYENDNTIRVYWVDGVEDTSNPPRVFTFKYDRSAGNPSFIPAYSLVTTNVHSMNSQSEFSMGIIKYVKKINGGVLTGVYQYTYSLGTDDGYNTPWYPLTREVFVTSDLVSSSNWNEYEMESSGTTTSKGNRIEVKGIDQKFSTIRVAYVYSTNETSTNSASIFSQVEITSDIMTFDHVANQGEPLLLDEIVALFSGIRAAKTLNIKDSTLYYGNVNEGIVINFNAEDILANLRVRPTFKDMRSDTKNYVDHPDGYGWIEEPPVTHANPETGTTTKRLWGNTASGQEQYVIDNDYVNYKGTQVDHLYTGYFRGETYRFAIVLYDKLGFPYFAVHLCDIKFPEQSSNTFTANRVTTTDTIVNVAGGGGSLSEAAWPTNNFNEYLSPVVYDGSRDSSASYIRIMGLEVSGLDLSSVANSISGFKIVRTKLDNVIITQGLIYPTLMFNDDSRVIPLTSQEWIDQVTMNSPTIATPIPDIVFDGGEFDGSTTRPYSAGTTTKYGIRPNLQTFYAPDIDFGLISAPVVQSQDRLRLVGGCYSDNPPAGASGIPAFLTSTFLDGVRFNSLFNKMYYSKNTAHVSPLSPGVYPQYLAEADISESILAGLGSQINDYEPGLTLHNGGIITDAEVLYLTDEHRGWGKGNTLFYKTGNFNPTGSFSPMYQATPLPSGNGENMGAFICNYVRPDFAPYGGLSLSALERNIFYGTGHFQPIGNPTFANAVGHIYDNIEVWGGDCYLDYFGFLKMYSRIDDDTIAPYYPDINIGLIFPWESRINHTMRNAPSQENPMYTDIGSRCAENYLGGGLTSDFNGIYHFSNEDELREEFDINSALLREELIQFYTPKPINFADNIRFPVRWRYSINKVYGDPVDSWRTFQVFDFRDVNGEYGEITSSLYIFNQIYSWQLSAFGRLRASDRALIESSNAGTLTTGIGDKLDGVDYVSTIEGNQHQWSLFSSGKAAYWINVDMKSIMRFAQDGRVSLSDTYGVHDFSGDTLGVFTNLDNPAWAGGIAGVFDHDNGDAIWSLNYDEYYSSAGSTIVSSVRSTQNSIIWENNETIFYNSLSPFSPTQGIYFPTKDSLFSEENYSSVYYVCSSPISNTFGIFNLTATGIDIIATVLAGECYKVYRVSNTDLWQAVQVTRKEVSPEPFSISYSENLNSFQGFHAFKSTFFMSHNDNILSYDNDIIGIDNKIYIHDQLAKKNTFYELEYKAILSSVVSEGPMLQKIFDDVRVNCNKEASESMTNFLMETETQSYFFNVPTDTRKKYLEDILRFPIRTKVQKDRIRGKHLRMTFEFLHNSFKSVRMTNLVTFFRNSNRI
tara:strand:+ start:345 stop:4688 length:4344 start_codon:yes stop_codon:yes gene_type:complete